MKKNITSGPDHKLSITYIILFYFFLTIDCVLNFFSVQNSHVSLTEMAKKKKKKKNEKLYLNVNSAFWNIPYHITSHISHLHVWLV